MNISLTPELEEFVNKRVESGKYQDALAVIQEGLRSLEEKERIYKGRFEELRKEVMIGVEQLRRGGKIDGETAIRQLQEDIIQRSGRTPPPSGTPVAYERKPFYSAGFTASGGRGDKAQRKAG